MSNYSHLFGFTDYMDFSVLKSFLWGDDKKEEKPKEKKNNNKNENKRIINRKYTYTNTHYSLNQKQKKLILKLEKKIDDYLYRKKVKNLIQKTKDNYMIVCNANIQNLFLNINRTKKIKQYLFTYEPILHQNVAFLPRKVYRNKKKLKFTICNIKKEIFIEPTYQTEYENNSFVNVLDLQDIKDKEYKNEEDFQKFLKSYFKKDKSNKIEKDKNEEKKEEKIKIKKEEQNYKNDNLIKVNLKNKNDNMIKVNLNNKNDNVIKVKINKKEKYNNIKTNITNSDELKSKNIFKHRKLKSDFNININDEKKKKVCKSLLKSKVNHDFGLTSILKERSQQKIKNERKISFGDVEFSY